MKRKKTSVCLVLVTLWLSYFGLQAQVGQWRNHFAATNLTHITQWGNEFYASRSTDILCYNTEDNTLSSISKRNGLAGDGIVSMAYHASGNCLVIGYLDGNVDLYYGSSILNLPEIKNKNIVGGRGKSINRIFTQGKYAYLACGFGVVVMDVVKQEFKETYFIGQNNASLAINDVRCDDQYIWACTEQGILYADKDAVNLNDYTAWKSDTFFGARTEISVCCKVGEDWWALIKTEGLSSTDKLYKGKLGGEWVLQDSTDIKKVSMISQGRNYLLRGTYRASSQKWSIDLLNQAGELKFSGLIDKGYDGSIPFDAILDQEQNLWAAGSWASVMRFDHNDGRIQDFFYWGPALNSAFSMTGSKNKLFVASGGYDATYVPIFHAGDISLLRGRDWSFINGFNVEGFENFRAITQVLEDPHEEGHLYVSSAVDGFMEIRKGKVVQIYNQDNSPLNADKIGYCRVYGLALDGAGNVWMNNPGSSTALLQYQKGGMWKAYDISSYTQGDRLGAIMVDYWQHIWIIDNRINLYVFEVQGDHIRGLQIDPNRGGTSSITTSRINCILEDDLGWIWLGTERGVKVIDKHAEVFKNPNGNFSSVECRYVMVPSGSFLIELLKNEYITSIIHDGANRKWIGTQSGGSFLVSSDGTKELEHFTAETSPLLSNQITALGMTPYGGEIFFACPNGLCSYQGTSTFREEGAKALPFPNPVPPGYAGYISIKNLPKDAEVKITDVSGHLIYEGRAGGSQLSWNGYNMQGKRPQSGILLVFASTSEGDERMVCKIFYVK